MLSLGALLASHNPALKAQAEARAKRTTLAKTAEGLEKQIEVSKGTGSRAVKAEARTELAKVKKQQFELDPTKESFEAYASANAKAKRSKAKKYKIKAQESTANAMEEKINGRSPLVYTNLSDYLAGHAKEITKK